MSAGFPYLQKLRKTELLEFAEATDMQNYGALKKVDLEVALDDHLRANQTTYSKTKDPSLGEYYKRLGVRAPKKQDTIHVRSDDESPAKKPKRKTKTPTEDVEASSETDFLISDLVKTPARVLARASTTYAQVTLPPSPAVVTNVIDRQTRRMSISVQDYYNRTGVQENIEYARELLSSPIALSAISLFIEACGLCPTILPFKAVGDLPAIPFVKDSKTTVSVPDLFLLLSHNFWAPFSLWSLTSIILPLVCAYFINIPLKTHPTHNYATRRATARHPPPEHQFDPLVFNVAKALLAYLVYAAHFTLLGLYQNHTIMTVNDAILGGHFGLLTTSSISGLMSLYEAILRMH